MNGGPIRLRRMLRDDSLQLRKSTRDAALLVSLLVSLRGALRPWSMLRTRDLVGAAVAWIERDHAKFTIHLTAGVGNDTSFIYFIVEPA